jgi:hypothetical protein
VFPGNGVADEVVLLGLKKPPKDIVLLSVGPLIGDDEVRRLLGLVEVNPGFREARLKLMSATRASQPVRAAQVCWFADHEPQTFLGHHAWMAATGEGLSAGEFYEDAKQRWLLAADSRPNDPDVVENAAWFTIYFEPERGEDLLVLRSRQERDPEWSRRAMAYLENVAELHPRKAVASSAGVVEAGYRVFRLEESVKAGVDLLPAMVISAEKAGLSTASRLLKSAEAAAVALIQAGPGLEPQLADTVLGFVALAEGDIARAEALFRGASLINEIPSESLVSLADELVNSGATGTVLTVVEAWGRRFQECAQAALDWASAIRTGRRVLRPTFPVKKRD